METLAEIYRRHCTQGDVGHGDKGGVHSYIDVYERLLAPYRAGCSLMEIGVAQGLSMAMWREYMPTSQLVGVDLSIVFDPPPGCYLIAVDATKPEFADQIKDYKFEVIIDDGSHQSADQIATFKIVAPRVRKGGIYIIEDVLNLEASRKDFERLHSNMEVIDLRPVKGRFDDVLIVFRF